VMPGAYQKASGGGTLPAQARQIMCAARGAILEITGRQTLDDNYFTQTCCRNTCANIQTKPLGGTWSTIIAAT
jgi:hypothetical protein